VILKNVKKIYIYTLSWFVMFFKRIDDIQNLSKYTFELLNMTLEKLKNYNLVYSLNFQKN
jgi:hypothetical protein